MQGPSVSRRQLLAGATVSAASLALSATGVSPANAQQGGSMVSPQFLRQLADYGSFPLPPDRAQELAPQLAGPLDAFRGLRPANYDALAPATVFQVPAEG
ncbi:MAG: twin-arginine translocation signal domain-containing protein [Chloroflexi bacterium]|jgi:hypothetical protein|nr:twin-arginine translocation signal domain-containing protein [Chloroflexota bacterium]